MTGWTLGRAGKGMLQRVPRCGPGMIRGVATILLALIAVGCRSRAREVVVYTAVDQVFSEPILADFEKATGITVRAVFDT